MSDRSSSFSRIPIETWIIIGSFLSSLREFMRLWMNCQELQKQIPKSDSLFWKALLIGFLSGRKLAVESISVSITGTSRFLSSSRKVEKGSHDDFKLIESLFTKRKCSRSGCFKNYEEWENSSVACCYHPGQLKSGMFLSCCRAASFQQCGCKYSFHSGMFHFMLNSFRSLDDTRSKKSTSSAPSTIVITSTSIASPSKQQSSTFLSTSLPPISGTSSISTDNASEEIPGNSIEQLQQSEKITRLPPI